MHEGGAPSAGDEDAKQQTPSMRSVADFAFGAIPFGLEKHLGAIPVLGRFEGVPEPGIVAYSAF